MDFEEELCEDVTLNFELFKGWGGFHVKDGWVCVIIYLLLSTDSHTRLVCWWHLTRAIPTSDIPNRCFCSSIYLYIYITNVGP